MIIDFHTHVFPDEMAPKTIAVLSKKAGFKAFRNGTIGDLYNSMEEANIDISVLLPVITAPKHLKKVNDIAIENNKLTGIISFGGIHPDNLEYEEELERLKENGIKGIKIHPEYQNCYIDDDRYIRIIEKAFSLGLIVITHSGIDLGYPECDHSSIEHVLRALEKIKTEGIFVLAHMGDVRRWDEVIDKLCGKNVYFDLAFCLGEYFHGDEINSLMTEDILKRFIQLHGSDRILFATDSPWLSQKRSVELFNSFDLDEEIKKNILYKNAKRILKI